MRMTIAIILSLLATLVCGFVIEAVHESAGEFLVAGKRRERRISNISGRFFTFFLAIIVFLCGLCAASAEPRIIWRSAPAENLEHADVALFARARTSIDCAAYVLTDFAIIDALAAAGARGAAVRVVIDGTMFAVLRADGEQRLRDLAGKPGVQVRVKLTRPQTIMHFKACAIDAATLRTGSANFSASGLKLQDNDALEIEDPAIAQAFLRTFERIWSSAQVLK